MMDYIIEKQRDKYREYPATKSTCEQLQSFVWEEIEGKMLFYLPDIKAQFERPDAFNIANDNANIQIRNLSAKFLIDKTTLFCERNSQEEAIYLNGHVLETGVYELTEGDELFVNCVKLRLQKNYVVLIGDKTSYDIDLNEEEITSVPFEGFPKYKRSPRLIKRVSEEKISLQKPPEKKKMDKKGLLQTVIPPLGMLAVTVAVGILLGRGIYMMMSVAGTLMTTIFSVVKFYQDRKENKDMNEKRKCLYDAYLLRKRKEINQAMETEANAFAYNYPVLKDISKMVHEYDSRIYERNSTDDDFLTISIGHSVSPTIFKIDKWNEDFKLEEDKLKQKAIDLREEFISLDKPRIIDLKRAHLGLVGEKEVIHEQLKNYISQMAFLQSYHDLQFVVLYDAKYKKDFEWMRWLPHTKIRKLNVLGMIHSERIRDQILGSMNQILKERSIKLDESKKESKFMPYFVFVIDEPKLIMDHSIMEYLDRAGSEMGFSIIYTSYLRANLPENIGTVLMLESSEEGRLLLEERDLFDQPLKLYKTKDVDLEAMARDLGVLVHEQGVTSNIPESITFFNLYKVQHPQELDVRTRWNTNNSHKSLEVPLGVRAEDDIVNLNLHEKAHGPHGLVAGTTGSGKSEIVQSYILSLAVNFHPYEVGFLLIDYKGGGMAGLFKKLPHLMGTITNLDGGESMRALASIKSELQRRQRIFIDNEVNHINGYMRLFKEGKVEEPLPHLFIISDEFAELKKEQPEFMSELISTARIGRSLGVHLILATQKPTGVVDDQIWSNSKFKLCLKVQNETDSKEVLKTPDAASITQAGRAYLQVGNNEIYELFQSAWSGALYIEEQEKEVTMDNRVYIVNELGQGVLVNRDLSDSEEEEKTTKTQLDVIVDHIQSVYEEEITVEIKRPWLPPLAETLVSPYGEVSQVNDELVLCAPLGVVDIPEQQLQQEYCLDFMKEGNLLYIASSGYGKTVFLTTALTSLAAANKVSNLNYYILDFGNSGLVPLRNLPHTADYITVDDEERYEKFKKIIVQEMDKRKKLLANHLVPSIEAYNRLGEKPLKAIIIAIDNFDIIKEMGLEEESVYTKITRDGVGLGIYTIASATRLNALRQATLNNFKTKIAGFNFDPSETQMTVGRGTYQQSEIKGRALIKEDEIHALQIYTMVPCENDVEYVKKLCTLIEEIKEKNDGEEAPHIPVLPETFTNQMFNQYKQSDYDFAIGLDKEEVTVQGMERNASPFVIIGETGRGKTNIIQVLLAQAAEESKVYLFDSASMELYRHSANPNVEYISDLDKVRDFMDDLNEEIEERSEKLEEILEGNSTSSPKTVLRRMGSSVIMIDDLDDFLELTKPEATKMAGVLKAAIGIGITCIIGVHAAKPRGIDETTKIVKQASNGLVLGAQGLSNIFPVSNMRLLPEFGDGLLFKNGTFVRVKLPENK